MKIKLKNYYIGFGIFALIFSLNLFIPGTLTAGEAAKVPFYSPLESSFPEAQLFAVEIPLPGLILQSRTENSELHDMVRKFPASLGLLFLFPNLKSSESHGLLNFTHHSFHSVNDLFVAYRNLRI